jgi:Ca2+-binding RTX toxin-like protein
MGPPFGGSGRLTRISISTHTWTRALPLVGALASLLFATSASAATTNPFGCRASDSAVRPLGSTAVALEPVVANPAETPCATDQAGVGQASTGSTAAGATTAGPAGAYTYSAGSAGAAAVASVDGGALGPTGDSVVLEGPAQAQASYACANGGAVASGSSNVTSAVINGQTVKPPSPGAAQTTQLGGGSYVTINQQVQSGTSLTERLAYEHIAGVADYILGEAQVTLTDSNACAGTGSGSGSGAGGGSGSGAGGGSGSGSGGGSGSGLAPCPTGSTLVASRQLCEIVQGGGERDIVVSAPFAGPIGGTVMSLANARKKYKSTCLAGSGPKFAVVGTKKADSITAAKNAERILGLGGNDRITIKSGASCVDGGAGKDTLSGGSGKVRLYGGNGNDKITTKNGNSYANGGNGADRITVGNGRDRVLGGAGNDVIKTGRGRDHVYGGLGNDRLRAAGNVAWLNGGKGKDTASVVAREMKYAHRHGCETVRRIRAKA